MPCPTYDQNFKKIRPQLFELPCSHTDKQTNKVRQKHNLFGGGNYKLFRGP